MLLVKKVLGDVPPPLEKSPFIYELTSQAAEYNSKVLAKFNYDLTRLIAGHPNTEISPGSEFRSTKILEPIFRSHKLWSYLKESLLHGVKTKLKKISSKARKKDLAEAIARGNHKSAQQDLKLLKKLVKKDVHFGF